MARPVGIRDPMNYTIAEVIGRYDNGSLEERFIKLFDDATQPWEVRAEAARRAVAVTLFRMKPKEGLDV